MAINLSYLDDLSRVRIALSDRADGTVHVEGSATSGFQLPLTVRGGVELPISGGVGQLDWYEFFADVENWIRVTPIDPAGLLLPGASGDYASTPDHASLDIVGDIDLRVDATRADWGETGTFTLVGKYDTGTNQRSYRVTAITGGIVRFQYSTNGTGFVSVDSTVALPVTSGRIAIRVTFDVDNGASGHDVTFYTATTMEGPWSQLGSVVTTAGTVAFFSGSAALEAGSSSGGTANLWAGTVHAAEVRDGIDGTVVANPDFAAQSNRDTSFVDAAGRTWTVNGNAEIAGVDTASITPSLDGQVWFKSVEYPLLNTVVAVSDYGDIQSVDRSGIFLIEGRSLPTGVAELHGGRDYVLVLASDNDEADAHLDVMSRVGRHFFIHVPTVAAPGCEGNLLLPGSMYVLIGRPVRHRLGGVSHVQHLALPLTEVNRPGPDIVGTTLTWDSIRRLYGSWESVWAAHSTWRSLWETIGSPDDLFVP